ncbi:cytochrome P450 [Amycolatopsis decaplanina]|uniref:Cytochrome P450 n=1 Tax=Amycolatopsis decaplanina DSM 44594 TaxID=1284240 RepID=M2Y0D9_9PSEU|nr:cytochrome P450 [Amycolatopsis decaplanina]EME54995.1 cytochrome P450 [Amycolatopsis decaplanina DSM 44594]
MSSVHADVWDFPFDEEGLELNESYRRARTTPGLVRVQQAYGEAAWLATRYEDVRFVLADPRFSRAMSMTENCPRTTEGVQRGGLLFMDRQDHSRIRGLVAKAFTMRQVAALRPKVHELTDTLAGRIASGTPPVDLVEGYAKPARSTVIFELLGIPPEDRDGFRGLCEGVLSTGAMSAEEFGANHVKLNGYMAELVQRRRREPGEDLMTALIAARDVRDRLSEDELVNVCIDILLPAYQSQVPNFVHALMRQPGTWDRLVAEPRLLPSAVEELVRFVPLVEGAPFPRYATEDIAIGGVAVRAGEPVLVSMAAANRDSSVFVDADELVLDREDNRHLGFGHGIHFCLGAQLARMALYEELGALLRRIPTLRPAGEAVWNTEMGIRGLRTMPVGW